MSGGPLLSSTGEYLILYIVTLGLCSITAKLPSEGLCSGPQRTAPWPPKGVEGTVWETLAMIFGSELKLSKVQAAESGCLQIVHGVTIRVDTVRSCQISQFETLVMIFGSELKFARRFWYFDDEFLKKKRRKYDLDCFLLPEFLGYWIL